MNSLLVPVSVYSYTSEAHIAKSFLEAHEILSFIFDEHLSYTAWHMTWALGGIRLMVHRDDFEDAQALLQIMNEDSLPEIDEEDIEDTVVVSPTFWDYIISIFAFLLFGLPLPWHKRKRGNSTKCP